MYIYIYCIHHNSVNYTHPLSSAVSYDMDTQLHELKLRTWRSIVRVCMHLYIYTYMHIRISNIFYIYAYMYICTYNAHLLYTQYAYR